MQKLLEFMLLLIHVMNHNDSIVYIYLIKIGDS